MRTEDLFSPPRSAVLDAPEDTYAPPRRRSRQPQPASRRDFGDDFASSLPDTSGDDEPDARRRKNGYRLRLNGRPLQVPKTLWGRIFSAIAFLVFLGVCTAALAVVRSFFLHDPRFIVASSAAIQTTGNTHLSRAQLLSVFGEDVERNIFNIPLASRRTQLESLPWVQHATVMRLLPNHIRIAITERTPVAFVRQGNQIGMVDASGVLLDMPPDAPGDPSYSFPVITGINAADPLSTRAARMKIYTAFIADLDSTADHISQKFSEVDLSNPEDVKALIPEGNNDILVHFGDTDFLARYQRFADHLHEWLIDHPKLASADMRYEHQVVLEMQPGASTSPASAPPAATVQPKAATTPPPAKSVAKPAPRPTSPQPQSKITASSRPTNGSGETPASRLPARQPPPAQSAASKPAPSLSPKSVKPATTAKPATSESWHMVVVKPHTKAAADLAKARLAHPIPAATKAAPQ